MSTVWIVGAGPGHPDLITVRGRTLLTEAGAILYAGSLVDPGHLAFAPTGCALADSSAMTMEQMIAWLLDQASRHATVVRLQTGDPSLYGAVAEMAPPLTAAGVEVRVVAGVSSALAAAAAAIQPLTLPEIAQTVIFTRVAGRTPTGENEQLRHLARHGATLCLFLSATLGEAITQELTAAGWAASTPMLLVHRVSYSDERIIRTTLEALATTLRAEQMTGQTMIITGPVVDQREPPPRSRLYDPSFSHGYRQEEASY